jgi:CBS domain-containing protein
MEHLDTFLARHPPFDALPAPALAELAGSARRFRFRAEDAVLVEDGPPAEGLWVVLSGSAELVHEGEAIYVLDPGECFGQTSLLTGMAPAYTVRARGELECALLARGPALLALGSEAGAAYVARSLRLRLTRTGHTIHGLLDTGTTPVSAVMRPAQFIEATQTIRTAARRLGRDGTSALLVWLPNGAESPLGIVTDAEIRAGVVERGVATEQPVSLITRAPAPTIPRDQLAVEASVAMLAAGVECVVVLDRGRPCGVLSAADLVGLDARSPIALSHTISGAPDLEGLARAASHMPDLFRHLVAAGVSARDIGRLLSLQHDALVARLIELSLSAHGPAPVSWAWLDLGSAARREFTLASDQDNALAYAAPPAGISEGQLDAYFARLGADVNSGLERCGVGTDNSGVLARERAWRMSKAGWVATFDECLRDPSESHLVRSTVAFDFRAVAGALPLTAELTGRIRAAREHPGFMRLLARTASGYPVALTRLGQLAVERTGASAGRIDLKQKAIVPLVNLVRFHAIAAAVTISPTLDRIEAVASLGAIDRALAGALAEAFETISRLRLEHHAARIAAGLVPDNLIDPGVLPPIARGELREALRTIRRGQRQVEVWIGVPR